MKKYKVKIRNTDREEIIRADSELAARVKFCEKNNLNYRHLAGKLEITQETKIEESIKKEN
ncbi:hypothetical protein HYZ82_00995 [Candidatus Nomurabacteria bacterium]|nr:hypothetical protein [Candidatus Nomurabacteria bacterium]